MIIRDDTVDVKKKFLEKLQPFSLPGRIQGRRAEERPFPKHEKTIFERKLILMKKLIRIAAFTLCAALALSATACTAPKKTTEVSSSSENVQIPNPWVDCKTIEDAEKLAGFDFLLPETPDGYAIDYISAIENDIIQVIYKNGDKEIVLRKAAGMDDASGDYNTYDTALTKEIQNASVTMKGSKNEYKLAIWTSEEYAYSVSSSEALSEDAMTELAESVVLANMLIGGDPATWGPALDSAD